MGYAPDYVEAMWSMLQADEPEDYGGIDGRPCAPRNRPRMPIAHDPMPVLGQQRKNDPSGSGRASSAASRNPT
jgi:hypothetical protein